MGEIRGALRTIDIVSEIRDQIRLLFEEIVQAEDLREAFSDVKGELLQAEVVGRISKKTAVVHEFCRLKTL